MPRITKAALGVLALQIVLTVVAVAADWRTRFEPGADAHPVSSAWVGHGSAVSSPLNGLVLLVLAGLVALRFRRVGMVLAGLVAILIAVGGIGEVLSSPSSHTPRAVLIAAGLLGVAQAAAIASAIACARSRSRRSTAPAPSSSTTSPSRTRAT